MNSAFARDPAAAGQRSPHVTPSPPAGSPGRRSAIRVGRDRLSRTPARSRRCADAQLRRSAAAQLRACPGARPPGCASAPAARSRRCADAAAATGG